MRLSTILPSPDGFRIASSEVRGRCDDGLSGHDVVVTFIDRAGKKLATADGSVDGVRLSASAAIAGVHFTHGG